MMYLYIKNEWERIVLLEDSNRRQAFTECHAGLESGCLVEDE